MSDAWYRSVSFPNYEISTSGLVRRRMNGKLVQQRSPGTAVFYDSGVPHVARIEDLLEEALMYGEEDYVHHAEDFPEEEWYQSVSFPKYDVSTNYGVRRHKSQRPLTKRDNGVTYRISYQGQPLTVHAADLLAEVMNGENE